MIELMGSVVGKFGGVPFCVLLAHIEAHPIGPARRSNKAHHASVAEWCRNEPNFNVNVSSGPCQSRPARF